MCCIFRIIIMYDDWCTKKCLGCVNVLVCPLQRYSIQLYLYCTKLQQQSQMFWVRGEKKYHFFVSCSTEIQIVELFRIDKENLQVPLEAQGKHSFPDFPQRRAHFILSLQDSGKLHWRTHNIVTSWGPQRQLNIRGSFSTDNYMIISLNIS